MKKSVTKNKKVKPLGYICGTDPTDIHLGATDVVIFPTIKQLKKKRSCWKECGIYEVHLGVKKVKGTNKF